MYFLIFCQTAKWIIGIIYFYTSVLVKTHKFQIICSSRQFWIASIIMLQLRNITFNKKIWRCVCCHNLDNQWNERMWIFYFECMCKDMSFVFLLSFIFVPYETLLSWLAIQTGKTAYQNMKHSMAFVDFFILAIVLWISNFLYDIPWSALSKDGCSK